MIDTTHLCIFLALTALMLSATALMLVLSWMDHHKDK